jgi:hypothetical protein
VIQKEGDVTGWILKGTDRPLLMERASVAWSSAFAGKLLRFDVRNYGGNPTSFWLAWEDASMKGQCTFGNETSTVSLTRAVYRVGSGVSAPVLIHKTDPEVTDAQRSTGYQGTVTLFVEVAPERCCD